MDRDRYNLIDISIAAREAMFKKLSTSPNCKYEDVVDAGVAAVMRLGKGIYNPAMVRNLVMMERSIFKGFSIMLPC